MLGIHPRVYLKPLALNVPAGPHRVLVVTRRRPYVARLNWCCPARRAQAGRGEDYRYLRGWMREVSRVSEECARHTRPMHLPITPGEQ